jgi:hypothetical protein
MRHSSRLRPMRSAPTRRRLKKRSSLRRSGIRGGFDESEYRVVSTSCSFKVGSDNR